MKKIIFVLMMVLSFSMVGCSSSNKEVINKQESEQVVNQENKKDEIPFPQNTTQIGNGVCSLYCVGGNSEGGNVPKILLTKSQNNYSFELVLNTFDSSKFTYVFVNQKYMDKTQVSLQTQHDVDIKDSEFMKDGIYTVSIVQFKDDTMKEVTEYHEIKYEIKH